MLRELYFERQVPFQLGKYGLLHSAGGGSRRVGPRDHKKRGIARDRTFSSHRSTPQSVS